MNTEKLINIRDIIDDALHGTKLWSQVYGDVWLCKELTTCNYNLRKHYFSERDFFQMMPIPPRRSRYENVSQYTLDERDKMVLNFDEYGRALHRDWSWKRELVDGLNYQYDRKGELFISMDCLVWPSEEHQSWDGWQEILIERDDYVTATRKDELTTYTYLGKFVENGKGGECICQDIVETKSVQRDIRFSGCDVSHRLCEDGMSIGKMGDVRWAKWTNVLEARSKRRFLELPEEEQEKRRKKMTDLYYRTL